MPGREMDEGFLHERWERSETSAGIPYYLNHNDETTHWEHPMISKVFLELDAMNRIKYGAYRTAMKLRAVQKITHLNEVDHHILENSYTEHGLGPGPKRNTEILSVGELEALLVTIFQHASRDRDHFIQPEKCVELTLSLLLRCLDSGRTGRVKVRSLKIILITLSQTSLELKYEGMFKQVCTENCIGISQRSVKTLLQDLFLLTDSVSESNTFGLQYVDNAIENCWNISNIQPTDTVNQEELKGWMLKEPLCIVWLPTLHRLATAETVKHESKCSKCKTFPIVGFRYRCLKCTNVDLCQSCYWSQMTLKNHKITHPTREYCLATTTGDDVKDFMKQVKNKITRRYRHRPPKINYLKYPIIPRNLEESSVPDQCLVFDNVHARVNLLASRLQELEYGADETITLSRSHSHYKPDDYILSSGGHGYEPENTDVSELLLTPISQPWAASQEPQLKVVTSSPQPPPPVSPECQPLPDLQSKLRLESRIIELQGNNQAEVASRKKTEKRLNALERSKHEDLEVKCELEQQVYNLTEDNQLLKEKMTRLLATPPMIKTVKIPVPVPVPVQSSHSSITEVRTQGVNTASQFGDKSLASSSQVSSLLGGEEEEMEAILREILAAFPKQTKSMPTELNNKVFKSVKDVGNDITSLVSHMKLS